jgi:hypothetical protein
MEEEWRQSYVPLWEVSNFGRVRNKKLNHVIKPFWKNTYLTVGQGGRCSVGRHPVHKLICIAFHGNRPSYDYCIDHKDGNKENNRADNLRWCLWSENSRKGNRPLDS